MIASHRYLSGLNAIGIQIIIHTNSNRHIYDEFRAKCLFSENLNA